MKLQRILLEAQSENLMKKLEAMAANGELTTDQINTLTHSLKTALRKHQTSKRSPESYKTAAEKAKATRAQNAKDIDSNIKAGEEVLTHKSKAEKERRLQGLLPSQLSSTSRDLEDILPDLRKYYDQGPSPDGTTVGYSIRAKYRDTPVDNAEDYWNQSSSTTNETDTNNIKMKKQINEVRRMQVIAGILKEDYNTLDEAPASLATKVSNLYDKTIELGVEGEDVNDLHVDGTMEDIIKKVGLTPEQQKKKGFYKFAFGDHPEFETLTDEQLQAIIPFLKAVIRRREYGVGQDWNGTKIVDDDMNFSDL